MQTLRELRKAKGITMKELGDVVGVAESTISQYETGKRSPDFETLLKFGEFFNVSTDYLLRYDFRDWENITLPPICSDAYNTICTQLLNIARVYGLEDIYSELRETTPPPERLKEMAQKCRFDATAFKSLSENCIEQSVMNIAEETSAINKTEVRHLKLYKKASADDKAVIELILQKYDDATQRKQEKPEILIAARDGVGFEPIKDKKQAKLASDLIDEKPRSKYKLP